MHLTKLHYVALPSKVQQFKTPVIAAITATVLSQFTLNFQWSTNSFTQNSPLIQQCPMIARVAKEAEATTEQESELYQICQDKRSEIENILTPEQREVFNASMAEGKSLPYAIRVLDSSPELKLSDQQRERLKGIRKSTLTRIEIKFGWNVHEKIPKSRHLQRENISLH
ncbi:hypothetical protein [Nostoc sp.]|uniref:hypothetical protein n=1 Tax=Nostoc sp. TaxID=1180 RepID=UPI002FF5930D